MRKLNIIIPTYNHAEKNLKDCLKSLFANTELPEESLITVIANGCKDNTREIVALYPSVNLIWFDEPLGYPKAINEAVKANNDFESYLFLNDDVIIREGDKTWLKRALKRLEIENVGSVGITKVPWLNREFISGCVFFIKGNLFRKLGMFDEIFSPGYCEDVDLSFKIQDAGYIEQVMDMPIIHKGSGTYKDTNYGLWSETHKKNIDLINKRYFSSKSNQTISLCLIVKNESDCLEKCINSVKDIIDEIIVVDTGSTDNTKEIAINLGAKVYDFKWINDFAAARNFAFSKATQRFILWLDADDIVEPAELAKLKELKIRLNDGMDYIAMDYDISRDADGNSILTLRRNRLVRREKDFKWHGYVHEYLATSGTKVDTSIKITHSKPDGRDTSDRNINIYKQKEREGVEFSLRDIYYFANEYKDHGEWREASKKYKEFLSREGVWFEDKINAIVKCAECLFNQDKKQEALEIIFAHLSTIEMRPIICCKLADIYFDMKNYNNAIFWYESARLIKEQPTWAFKYPSLGTWYPISQLCICYDRIGDHQRAYAYNEMSATYVPNKSFIAYNREYFKSILNNQVSN